MSSEDLEKKPISVGAWGGQEGISWNDGVHSTVRQIVIAHGACIDSIQIEYDEKGSSVWSAKHGGNGGLKTDKVKLVYPSEFLTSIHGYYGCLKERGPLLVRSITFESNRKTYGPYGAEQGTHFSFPTTVGKIVGFHGKSGWYLDAIGVYLKPLQSEKSSKALVHMQSHTTHGTENVGYSVIQGSAGDNYDIVVALRHKSDNGNSPSNKLSMQPSRDFSSAGNTDKTVSIEKLPSDVNGVATYGPWGGTGGNIFDDGIFTGIRQIHLSRNVGIVWIKIQYDREGQAIWSSKHGGTGGFKTERIIFDFPSEILTHITGTYGSLMYMGPNVIKSLTFHTNKGKRGPFGEEQGPSFSHKIDEGKIAGFHGREGLFLDAIGVHVMECNVKPAKHSISDTIMNNKSHVAEIDNPPWSSKLLLAKQGPAEEVSCGVIKEPVSCGPGPWGGDGGRQWDDGVFSGIRQIFVTRSADAICSIQIEYDRNGQSVWSVKHGGNGGNATHRVKLEYPHEVLTCVSGYYGLAIKDERHVVVIKSLTFTTSRGKYGPFGEEVGTFFTSTTTEGKVVGFHGKSSMYLDAIGVHMQHWLGNNRIPRSSIFKFF